MALLKGKNFQVRYEICTFYLLFFICYFSMQDRTLSITWSNNPVNNPVLSRSNSRTVLVSESEEDRLIEQSLPEGEEEVSCSLKIN